MRMLAKPIQDAIAIKEACTLPDGVKLVTIDVADYAGFARSPHAIEYDGELYGRSGWNSDRYEVYYRSDRIAAYSRR